MNSLSAKLDSDRAALVIEKSAVAKIEAGGDTTGARQSLLNWLDSDVRTTQARGGRKESDTTIPIADK